jgi:hypothetical protein
VFVREAEQEQVLVAFNSSAEARELRVLLKDTPVQGAARIAPLFGEAKTELAGKEIRINMPAQSLSIFALN